MNIAGGPYTPPRPQFLNDESERTVNNPVAEFSESRPEVKQDTKPVVAVVVLQLPNIILPFQLHTSRLNILVKMSECFILQHEMWTQAIVT